MTSSRIHPVLVLLVGTALAAAGGCTARRSYTPYAGAPCGMGPPPPAVEPAPEGPAIRFERRGIRPFVDADDEAVSTFAADVDDTSYVLARAQLETYGRVDPDGVRVEGFVNHFDYAYPPPAEATVTLVADGMVNPFDVSTQVLRFGLETRRVDARTRSDVVLTLCLDASASMGAPGRFDLVRAGVDVLLGELKPTDRVAIVAFGDRAWTVLPATPASDRARIRWALSRMTPRGATSLADGLRHAYRVAREHRDVTAHNRVLLFADGTATRGPDTSEGVLREVGDRRRRGTYLTVVGFGRFAYDDAMLEGLARAADGHYAYVADEEQAHRVFGQEIGPSLDVVAKDMKIQVRFDPTVVRSWRLLGYEGDEIPHEAIDAPWVDGGEVGPGHDVTALYQVKLWPGVEGRAATLDVRWTDPRSGAPQAATTAVDAAALRRGAAAADPGLRLAAAAAELAEVLRGSWWARGTEGVDIVRVLDGLPGPWRERADVRELRRFVVAAGYTGGHASERY